MKTSFNKTIVNLLLLVFAAGTWAVAQPDQEKVQAAKIAFITNRLNLTPKQAEQFWPLLNEFEAKRKELRESVGETLQDSPKAEITEALAKEEIKKLLAARQAEVDLDKEYADKFQKVITPKQVLALYKSEKAFTRMLVKRFHEGRKFRE